MPNICIVENCRIKGEGIGFFKLPFDENLRKQWLDQLNLLKTDFFLKAKKASYRVCFRHFHEKDYKIINKNIRLNPGM